MGRTFEQWFSEQRAPEEPELPDGINSVVKMFPDGSGTYLARCRRCERDFEMELDRLEDFGPDCLLCGGSPHCLP